MFLKVDNEIKKHRLKGEDMSWNEKSFFPSVRKRDFKVVPFRKEKITTAISKAAKSTGIEYKKSLFKELTNEVENYLKQNYLKGETLTIESIHNAIEKILNEKGYTNIANAYSFYRKIKEQRRKTLKVEKKKKNISDVTDLHLLVATETEAELSPWNREKIINALVKEADLSIEEAKRIAHAVEEKIISSGVERVATSFIRELVDNELLNLGYEEKRVKQTRVGIPSYDLSKLIYSKSLENSNIAAHNPEAVNLVIAETALKQYALNNLFSKDVADAHLEGKIHIHDLGYPVRVYCSSHSLEYLKKYGLNLENLEIISSPAKHARTLTGHLNTFLASMQAYYAGALGIGYINIFYAPYLRGLSYSKIKQEAQYLIFSLSQSAFSRGGQVLFLDANIHTGVPKYLKNVPAIGPGGKYMIQHIDGTIEYVKEIPKEYNNPLSFHEGRILTYNDFEKEAQEFARALMDVWKEGDAYGHVFSFPKMDFHINEDTFKEPRQYELFKYACEIASENGTPYFVFDRDEVTLSQCCRLKTTIDLKDPKQAYMIQHPESMRYCGFQNVTINLPQAAYRAGKGKIEKTLDEISEAMELAMKAHLQKKKFISSLMKEKGLPLWEIGKTAFDGKPYVDLDKATYIIGMIGLDECVQYLIGKQLHEGDKAYNLGLRIIEFMYNKAQEFTKMYGLTVKLEESPAESAARRLAKVDLQHFPQSKEVVKGNIENGEYYYANSIHFDASAPISLIERIIGQSRFHRFIESGAIIHAFIGEQRPSPEAIENLIIKTWKNTEAAQITISPEFTVCNICHRTERGLKEKCKYCGSNSIYGVTRIVGYFSRVSNWNKSKIGELKDRKKGKYTISKTTESVSNNINLKSSSFKDASKDTTTQLKLTPASI